MLNYKLFKENGIVLKEIKKINNVYIVSDNKNKYVVKEKSNNLDDIFNYLKSRNFKYFPNKFSIDKYNIYNYIDNKITSDDERLYEIINLISLLHTKTTRYKTINIDDYKIIYEKIYDKLKYLNDYYVSLNDWIDNEIYMSPSHYLLVLNISKIYSALSFCLNELDNWYELIKNNTRQRVAFIHNNLDIEHLLFDEVPYLISWDKAKVDIPIYDLMNLYDKYYNKTDFEVLFSKYLKKYPLSAEELKLFFILISIPKKVEFSKDEFNNIKKVKKLINYLNTGDKLIRPYYKKETKNK